MAAQLFYLPFNPVFTSRGLPAGAATVTFFFTGTTTKAPVYADSGLTTPLQNPVPANGLGQLVPIYMDSTITYRIRVLDANGAQLGADIDNYIPGTALKGDKGDKGDPGSITIAGIPYVTVAQFSAVGYTKADFANSGVVMTDTTAQIQAAINSLGYFGGDVWLENKYYRVNDLKIPANVHLRGVQPSARTRVFGEDATPFVNYPWLSYTGTIFVVDQNTRGAYCPTRTDVADPNTVLANSGATASNPTYWQYATANGTKIDGIGFYSKGGTALGIYPGIEIRSNISMDRCLFLNFNGPGVYTTASADASDGASKYGNADQNVYRQVRAIGNRQQGFRTEGRDANVILFDSCDSNSNGGWGYDDNGFLGNTYLNCHDSANNSRYADWAAAIAGGATAASQPGHASVNYGAYRLSNTAARHSLLGCYNEGGNGAGSQIESNTIVLGGIMSETLIDPNYGQPLVFAGNGQMKLGALTQYNTRSTTAVSVRFGSGTTAPIVLSWGDADANGALIDGTMTHALQYFGGSYKLWSMGAPGSTNDHQIAFSTRLTGYGRFAPFLQNGVYFGSPLTTTGADGDLQYMGVTTATSGSAMPAGLYEKNADYRMPATAGGKRFLVVTQGGAKGVTWTTGTTYMANSAAQLASFVENAAKVYRCTGTGSGNSTVAPTHSSGSVTSADGYTWLYMNANTVPVFKAWGVIDA